MALAIFDLDNTLIHGDSDYLWGKFLIEKGVVDGDHYEKMNDAFYADYQAGTLDILAYQRFSLAPLSAHPMGTLIEWRKTFMHHYILPIYQDKAQSIVDKHRQQGDQLLIITATNSFVTRPIADLYGIEALIGTDPEVKDNHFTGDVVGTPSFQQGKVTRLKSWLQNQQQDLKDSYFYSDSHNDIPLLELVDNPIMVDADEALLAHGQTKQWPSTSFRD
ncbi:HAD-IB family hydrolase [Hydrogenovibrio sp. SC-1]|uniref:histidinol-phosphatase n=1 Tax=Hydrogenovibrio sp. SC-1 TaxID=2065820 RepID=UPI000C7A3E61|nr:HAD family hydrolase [Hydrogenovibrio sp. SC-1]PLA73734.1 HAD-IB family hydrolase [Hydrogenovibrio sp. SC-1]